MHVGTVSMYQIKDIMCASVWIGLKIAPSLFGLEERVVLAQSKSNNSGSTLLRRRREKGNSGMMHLFKMSPWLVVNHFPPFELNEITSDTNQGLFLVGNTIWKVYQDSWVLWFVWLNNFTQFVFEDLIIFVKESNLDFQLEFVWRGKGSEKGWSPLSIVRRARLMEPPCFSQMSHEHCVNKSFLFLRISLGICIRWPLLSVVRHSPPSLSNITTTTRSLTSWKKF